MAEKTIRGTLDEVIINKRGIYEGDLVDYFQTVFNNAKNVNLPYHNFRHMMHVTWVCHDACIFYENTLTKRQMRNLLIAAMFHDFDHSGMQGNDSENIKQAIQGLKQHILPQDREFLDDIIEIIQATEYPYKTSSDELTLCSQIIRDADLSQALSPTWLQQVVFGLASEWKVSPHQVLQSQESFQNSLTFNTAWGQKMWPKKAITEKIEESTKLLEILNMKRTSNFEGSSRDSH